MPDKKHFDMKFRPAVYWEGPEAGFANIKGEMRRRILQLALQTGDFTDLPGSLLSDALSEEERECTGRIHPAYMGGEYLADYLPSEVEIARVSLNSVMWDVISIRARPGEDGRIHYRVVDEYETDFACTPESTVEPLSFAEMINLIETVEDGGWGDEPVKGLTDRYRDYNLVGSLNRQEIESLEDFVTVSSAFYPEISRWYEIQAREWVEERIRELEEES
jgi:hypothetical protein